MNGRWRQVALVVVLLVLTLLAGGLYWLSDLGQAMPEAETALASDTSVTVTTGGHLAFVPAEPASTGFIFYPGGRVPHEAYAPAVREIAEAGYLGVIVPAPFGLAVLAPDAADSIVAAYPDIEHWVIGGHSLGGAMAAQYAVGHDDAIDGLALWAAYPPEGTDLSGASLVASSISASNDGLATPDDIAASVPRLPADTTFVEIEGGNHAGFGWYGEQDGDGEATISRLEQQEQTVAATLDVLEAVAGQ